MKGLEICRRYFFEYGKPMIEENFPELIPHVAAGLFGSGSECFGYDDEVSRDHDFEAGFIIVLPSEDIVDRKTAFALERAYAKLPDSFSGLKRGKLSAVGGGRRGVIRAEDFFTEKTGRSDGLLSGDEWFNIPENYLAEAVNGEIFMDEGGAFGAVRAYLSEYPEDVRLKKLAGNLLLAGQAGQYNYTRCLAHGEEAAAQLAAAEFVRHAMAAVFLLNKKYMPYYKWAFRALKSLSRLSELYDAFEYLLTTDNSPQTASVKAGVTEDICGALISALKADGLTSATCKDLEKHAYSVNDRVKDERIRNRHILSAV